MIRLLSVSALMLTLLLFGMNGCDYGNGVEPEMPQSDSSDNPLISLVEDLRKVPVMTQDIFIKKIDATYPSTSYKADIQGMLDMNKENIRHREEILELIFSKDVISKVTPEMKAALQVHLNEAPISDIEMVPIDHYAYPYKYCSYLAELAADNNRHREFFIKKLRCFEIEIAAVVAE